MQHLALALIKTAAFLELSDDEIIDPDSAIAALEMISAELQATTELEKDALRAALDAELLALPDDDSEESEDARAFYEDFMSAFGLEAEQDENDDQP